MKIINMTGLSEPIYNACKKDTYSGSSENGYSVTEIIKPIPDIVLSRRHLDEITEDCADMANTLLGSAGHRVLELGVTPESIFETMKIFESHLWSMFYDESDKITMKDVFQDSFKELLSTKYIDMLKSEKKSYHILPERRLSIEFGKHVLSGGVDCINLKEKSITDFKFVRAESYEKRDQYNNISQYTRQLNMYRYLVYKKLGIEIEKLTIILVFKDWKLGEYRFSKMKGGGSTNYPERSIIEIDIPVMPHEWSEEFIESRFKMIDLYSDSADDEIPACLPEDRWMTDPTYRLFKEGNIRATKTSRYYGDMTKEKIKLAKTIRDRALKDKGEVTPSIMDEYMDMAVKEVDRMYRIEKQDGIALRCNPLYCKSYHFCNEGKRIENEK